MPEDVSPAHARLRHLLLAALHAAGTVCTVLLALGLEAQWPYALLATAAALGLCMAFSVRPRLGGLLLLALAVSLGVWLVRSDGLRTLTDALLALLLTLTGTGGVLPFFALPCALLLAFFLTLFSYAATSRLAGSLPSVMALVLLLVTAWKLGEVRLLWSMLPVAASCLVMCLPSDPDTFQLRRVLPVMVLIPLLALSVLPGEGVSVEPLRTFADTVRQKIMDLLFYTEPRNVFSLGSEGWYPQGGSLLGGKPDPRKDLVMVVRAPQTVYLRGAIKNTYTGRSWTDTTGGRRYLWYSPRWLTRRASLFDEHLPEAVAGTVLPSATRVTVQMLSASASDLFVPQRIRELTTGGDIIAYFNTASEVFATRDLVSGDTWTVEAPLLRLGDPGLDALAASCAALGADPALEDLRKTYTLLPSHLSSQLYDLAERITEGQGDDYGKAMAIAAYLRSHYSYSLDVETPPADYDFVTYFLLTQDEGYCTYFASAMAVLCRMVGIPSRYVEGYLARTAGESGAYITGENGHAWAEIYLPHFGWLTCDATPSEDSRQVRDPQSRMTPRPSSDPGSTPRPSAAPTASPRPSPSPAPTTPAGEEEPQTPSPSPEPIPTPAPEASPGPDPERPGGDGHTFPWPLLLLLLLILSCVRFVLTQPRNMASRRRDIMGRWLVYLQAVLDALSVLGLKRRSTESLSGFFARLGAEGCLPSPQAPWGQVAECSNALFYGPYSPVENDLEAVRALQEAVWGALPLTGKIRLQLLRALTGEKSRSPLSHHA